MWYTAYVGYKQVIQFCLASKTMRQGLPWHTFVLKAASAELFDEITLRRFIRVISSNKDIL